MYTRAWLWWLPVYLLIWEKLHNISIRWLLFFFSKLLLSLSYLLNNLSSFSVKIIGFSFIFGFDVMFLRIHCIVTLLRCFRCLLFYFSRWQNLAFENLHYSQHRKTAYVSVLFLKDNNPWIIFRKNKMKRSLILRLRKHWKKPLCQHKVWIYVYL